MKNAISVTLQLVPGAKEVLQVDAGLSVADVVRQSRFKGISLEMYRIDIGGVQSTVQAQLYKSCMVLLVRAPQGAAFYYSTSEKLMVYFDGRRGVKARRQKVDEFLNGLNTVNRELIRVEESDAVNRSDFVSHLDFLTIGDVSLIVCDTSDLNHPIVREHALRVPTFIANEFSGVADAVGSEDAFRHFQEVRERLIRDQISGAVKRKTSAYHEGEKNDALNFEQRIWDCVKAIMTEAGSTIITNQQIVYELQNRYEIQLTERRFSSRMRHFNQGESGFSRGVLEELKRMKLVNRGNLRK